MKMIQGIPHYKTKELKEMPTLAQGQADDLKWEDDEHRTRIWLARGKRIDGEPFDNTVTVERYDRKTGRWENAYQYDGDHPMTIVNRRRQDREGDEQ